MTLPGRGGVFPPCQHTSLVDPSQHIGYVHVVLNPIRRYPMLFYVLYSMA